MSIEMGRRRHTADWLARHFIGTPYIWGGDDPHAFDCSGLCVEILKSVGILPREGDWSSRGLYKKFPKVDEPQRGCLVFWASNAKPDYVSHVEFCHNEYLAIGASGGGSKTTSIEKAWEQNAYVKMRPILRDRVLVGYADPFAE